ncbi:aldo/keto reductase [Cystobacter ferrugineus]|uniref:Aldo/keto reductase n=1 Tax=Cystobacter ferrugineus TaxID=83449 RepID=A0A1L9B1C1_9BACT|nr:aldo/keto reductase [Cystobacter ferrugineus]OJH36059.1 aldo/keto reductase [Cystobacter ferrugineus]
MEKRKLGSLEVSVVGLGCNNFGWRLDAQGTATVVEAALDAGINFFDTATLYGEGKSEEFLGRALGKRRSQVIIASKFGHPGEGPGKGGRPAYLQQAIETSLRRLGTDYIDLYQLHMPDPETPIADTLGTLDALVRAGKVREIGCSNFSAAQLREAAQAVRPGAARFVSVQNEYSLLHREPEAEVLPESERGQLAFLPYFPLASGLLTGKYRPGQAPPEGSRLSGGGLANRFLTEENISRAEELRRHAESRGHTLLELAFSWLLARRPVASVIAGATSAEQVRANVAAAGWRLDAADLAKVDAITGSTSR